jgi:alkenylglycerophosphocholine hydrolase
MNDLLSFSPWTTLAVILAYILNFLVYWRNWHKLQPYSKPLAMMTIIFWTLSLFEWQMNLPVLLLILAQVFCLAGDVFLLFSDRWFMAGLVAFLIGHLFYLGLMASLLATGLASGAIVSFSPLIIFMGVMGLVVAMMVFLRVFKPAFNAKDSSSELWLAVQVYALVLSSMMVVSYMLVLARSEFTWIFMLVPVGGALFFASDFMLAYDRFVKENALLRLLVWITYHSAQICLAWGFINLLN